MSRGNLKVAACLAAAAAIGMALAADAPAQTARTFKIVVPYPPASGPDILSRLMAEQIGKMQGATVVIENRPGGGTMIGTEAVARAAPDGGTVLLVANSFVVNPALKPQSYDVTASFDPVCYLAATPMVLVVQGSSPYKTLNDLLTAARDKPGALSLGAAPTSSLHIAFEVIKRVGQDQHDLRAVPRHRARDQHADGRSRDRGVRRLSDGRRPPEVRHAARSGHRVGQAQPGPAARADLRRGRRDRL